MPIRATYALDKETDQHIRGLAKAWQVSQAEVARRSVRSAVEQVAEIQTPADVVARHAKGPLPRSREATERAIRSLRQLRHADDEHRTSANSWFISTRTH